MPGQSVCIARSTWLDHCVIAEGHCKPCSILSPNACAPAMDIRQGRAPGNIPSRGHRTGARIYAVARRTSSRKAL